MNKINFSIIIPTYNEEKNLVLLLDSLEKQNLKNSGYNLKEIIVADAKSKDKTKQIAKDFGCRIVKGGLPWTGKNNGAKKAIGNLLVFIDADVILPKKFLLNSLNEFNSKNLDIAGVNLIPLSNKKRDLLLHRFYNGWQKLMEKIDPHMAGACVFIKKGVFFEVGMFDEHLVVAEDHALARKTHKKGFKFKILKSRILINTRRLENEGRINFIFKLMFFWVRRFFGEVKKSKINYNLKDR
jgi:glycosyltransferase involved in cell wall biosynthesis